MLVMDDQTMKEFFGKDGRLSKAIPLFENREEQLTMASSIARSLENGGHLMIEVVGR